ncbi:MAG: flagellar basal body P-ring formation protein FlgA [Opitutaceae bacterium]|nr:flagellar basal body P-ring formation protein FlgA [Opitutaceae bacterium]
MTSNLRHYFSSLLAALAALAFAGLPGLRASPASPAAGTVFAREQALAALTRAVASHYNLEGDLQFELLRPWVAPTRTALAWDLEVVEFPAAASSTMMFRCRVLADGAPLSESSLLVRAQLWRDAWVARQPIPLGSGFDATALETRKVDLLRDREALPAAIGDRSYVFARAVSAGRLITWRDVARRPSVRKGDVVEVSAVEGLLVVTMKGLAMESGAKGDVVAVRNPESRKNFSAVVVDENRVQVRF